MGIEHPKYKVAAVQAAPAWLDLDASIAKTIALIEEAAAKGAKLIAFPEAFIPGYLGTSGWTRPPGRSAAVLCSAISTIRWPMTARRPNGCGWR